MFADIIPDIEKDKKKLKPWILNKNELEREMKQLGLRKEDLLLDEKIQPVVLDVMNNPVDRVTYHA